MDDLLYAPGHGLLYRLDPRTKLLFVVSVFVYLVLEKATAALLVVLCGIHILCLLSAGTRARIWPLWKMLLPLAAMVFLLGGLRVDIVHPQQAANVWVAIGPISITPDSLWLALGLSARIAGLTFAFSLALWTTEPGDKAHWRLSTGEVRLTSSATLRVKACRLGYRDSEEVQAQFRIGGA